MCLTYKKLTWSLRLMKDDSRRMSFNLLYSSLFWKLLYQIPEWSSLNCHRWSEDSLTLNVEFVWSVTTDFVNAWQLGKSVVSCLPRSIRFSIHKMTLESQSLLQDVEKLGEEVTTVKMSDTSYEEEKLDSPAIMVRRTTRRKQIGDAACIGLNIASTVILVFLNKWYENERNFLFLPLHMVSERVWQPLVTCLLSRYTKFKPIKSPKC